MPQPMWEALQNTSRQAMHERSARASLYVALGGGLIGLGLMRKGALGGALAAAGGAALIHALRDWFRAGPVDESRSFGDARDTIGRSVSDVYSFCCELDNLRSIVPQSVLPPGPRVGQEELDARLVECRPDELVVWRSLRGDIEHYGRMEFHPAEYGRATLVQLSLWRLPLAAVDPLVPDLRQQARETLRRLKGVLESGSGMAESFFEELQMPLAEDLSNSPDEDLTGWAPESGEPDESRTWFGRGEASSVSGDDVSLAPESGERFVDRAEGNRLSETGSSDLERYEESAAEHRVLEGSEESFPASDAPAWTPGRP